MSAITRNSRIRILLAAVSLAIALLVASASSGAPHTAQGAVGTGVDFAAATQVESFRALLTGVDPYDSYTVDVAWSGVTRYRQYLRTNGVGPLDVQIERGGLQQFGSGNRRRLTSSFVTHNAFAAEPDGYSMFDYRVMSGVPTALAGQRGGTNPLVPATVGGVSALRSDSPVARNDCAGVGKGKLSIWLDEVTLLPLRYRVKRGSAVTSYDIAYSGLNAPVAARAFRLLPARSSQRLNNHFHRTSASVAAEQLPYAPKLPDAPPSGFRLVVTGWAPMSGVTGPEASLPAAPALFSAVYQRGVERLQLSQRRATRALRRDWLASDPFAGECADVAIEDARVGGKPARYGVGPLLTPHLFWIDGRVAHTLSGPYPKAELVRIAESYAAVA